MKLDVCYNQFLSKEAKSWTVWERKTTKFFYSEE